LALLTPKNNPLFDVVVTTQDGKASVPIQVKTRSIHNTQGWKLSANFPSKLQSGDLLVALVNLTASGAPDIYIYEYKVLASRVNNLHSKYMSKPKRNGEPRKEVAFRCFDEKSFVPDDHQRRNNWGPVQRALGAT
jgi:hypothetical protein